MVAIKKASKLESTLTVSLGCSGALDNHLVYVYVYVYVCGVHCELPRNTAPVVVAASITTSLLAPYLIYPPIVRRKSWPETDPLPVFGRAVYPASGSDPT